MLGKLKQKFASWLLKGVHIDVLHIGEHSVVISGTGANMDGQKIENVGAPDSDDDVPRRVFSDLTGRWTLAQAHRGADGKIMVFKGAAADPVEEDKGFTNEVTSDPAADAAHLGQIIRVRAAAGNKTYVKMCVQNDADGYEWVQLSVST